MDHLGSVGAEQQQGLADLVRHRLVHQHQGGRESGLGSQDRRGETVVRAEPAGRDEPAGAVGESRTDDELELARLVPPVEGAGLVVALHEEPALAQSLQR
jgi:hypothetical protein